ncbi:MULTISPECIES: ArsR/SmtB family transcription factor [Psychrilyobacter]|uniref:ArsR family transcriptional regulator n=1 Tax=Psychrilyobacter piezotolerans TaxID=2293438 RepID=A0ABX9KIC3_9FUSO|nr:MULTISPECIES: metalloregulator ArsR/SmtB family transcription factor [Psychrilyobacter]MCS5421352.1 metalloregulator ArsR/SmtB family transcription factor [Psychrilyobacter sp. S5]NDI77508.1 winged helix-turn-helix transcriptional regulator [Psychrilyobacter piezotolerans]RDE62979.1 ArsR family transcriptional regulator [Psychrilyobacter sp. S5]REI41737.1 ArsR family transcriptional regulator [Psychrilyobacter piezotolerans]
MEKDMVKVFKGLGHPIRLKIVKKLGKERLCVCELQKDVEFSQSNLSQHLKIMRDSGILTAEKEGLKVMYQIKDENLLKVIHTVKEILDLRYLEEAKQS